MDEANEGSGDTGRGTPEQPASSWRKRSLLLRLCELFGMDGMKTAAEKTDELDYRVRRLAEMEARFPELVASGEGLEAALCRIHRILNRDKRYRNYHRLLKLLHPRGYVEGSYRRTRQRGADYLAPRPADVPTLMRLFGERLDQLVSESLDDTATRRLGAWALVMMIRIHPFADGNGRTTRTLMNLLLARAGKATIDFPSDSDVYKRSPVWESFKAHMRLVRDELGWSLIESSLPPAGYYDRLRESLEAETAEASAESLARRPDIQAIADALAKVRDEGFDAYRE